MGADISGHHQPAAIHLLAQSPDVDGKRGQVTTGRDQSVCQQDRTAKVQRNESTSPYDKLKFYFIFIKKHLQFTPKVTGDCLSPLKESAHI